MYRNSDEEKEYQALSYDDKQRYDMESRLDPSLTHKQIMALVGARIVTRIVINDGGGRNVSIDGPGIKKTILEKLDDWLFENARSVWRSVTSVIRDTINYLGNLIDRGISWIGENIIDPVADFLDDIFG